MLLLIGDPPDRIISILANEERAVLRHGESNWTAPNISPGRNESGQKILVNTLWFTAIERDAHHLVARAFGSVPGTVEGGKGVPAIGIGKLFAIVKNHVERS